MPSPLSGETAGIQKLARESTGDEVNMEEKNAVF
jgi:hypothetical protein